MYSPTTWAPKQRPSNQHQEAQHSGGQPVNPDGDLGGSAVSMPVEMAEHERKIVNEFCHYLEKSKQLFNGLR